MKSYEGKTESKFICFWGGGGLMEVSEDNRSTRTCFDISSQFFSQSPNLFMHL
jgi:hypothetical protein